MKIPFVTAPVLLAVLHLFTFNASAQPAVYSGVYAYGEGGLTTSTDWQAVTNFVTNAQKDVSIINNFDSWNHSSSSPPTSRAGLDDRRRWATSAATAPFRCSPGSRKMAARE